MTCGDIKIPPDESIFFPLNSSPQMRSQTVFLIISCILALMQSKTAQAYLQPYSSLEPIFRDNSTIQTSVASIMGQGLNDALLNIPELPACNIVVRSPVDHHSTHISMELIFDCGGWLACIDANVQSNKELFVNHLVGSTSGHCPKGKLLLGVLHTFAEVIGVKTIRLADASHIQLFRKRLSVLEDRISAKSSILLPLLSETEPREYTSYYSQFGYKIIGDSKSDLSNLNRNTQYLYSVSIKELLPQLRQSTTKEVKEILEGYPLFTPVSKVFRDLHQRGVEKSFEAHRDCIRLFQLIFSTDSEMSFFQSVPGLLDGSRLSKAIFNLGITRSKEEEGER